MNWGKHVVEAATLIIAAILCAMVSNAIASRERKLVVLPAPSSARVTPPPTVTTSQPTTTVAPEPIAPTRTTDNEQRTTPKQTPLQLPIKSVKAMTKQFNPHPDKPYIEIGGDDVAGLHSRGALFFAAPRPAVVEQGHISRARPFLGLEAGIDGKG